MQITFWLKEGAVIYMGGDPKKSQKPLATISADKPQIMIDEATNTVVIIETK
jgi:hypothetical protein